MSDPYLHLSEAAKIVERLNGLPLALAQAGAYIYEMGISPKKYLESYQARTHDIMTQNNDMTYANGSIMATFQISYNAVKARNLMAFRLLTILGFLDNSDVWWELFNLAWQSKAGFAKSESDLLNPEADSQQIGPDYHSESTTGGWLTELAKDETIFNKAIHTLREFYFVRRNAESDSFSIHPVVHQWLRQRLESEDWHANLNAAISLLGRSVPLAHFHEPWILQRRLVAHVDCCLELLLEARDDKIDSPEGFQGLAVLMFDQGAFERAEDLYRRAGEGWSRRRGPDHWQTRRAYHDLGLAYRTLRKYDEAEALWKRLLDACIRTEGAAFTQGACRLLDDLGRLFTLTQRYGEAETHFQRALAGREEQVQNGVRAAPEEPVTFDPELGVADTCRQYGILKQAQGKVEEAEALHQRALAIFRRLLGPNHTWALLSIADLGDISRSRGQLNAAEGFLKSALEGMEEHLGGSHNYTVKIYQDLGELLLMMGRKEEALGLLEKAATGLAALRGQDSAVASEAGEKVRRVRDTDGQEEQLPD